MDRLDPSPPPGVGMHHGDSLRPGAGLGNRNFGREAPRTDVRGVYGEPPGRDREGQHAPNRGRSHQARLDRVLERAPRTATQCDPEPRVLPGRGRDEATTRSARATRSGGRHRQAGRRYVRGPGTPRRSSDLRGPRDRPRAGVRGLGRRTPDRRCGEGAGPSRRLPGVRPARPCVASVRAQGRPRCADPRGDAGLRPYAGGAFLLRRVGRREDSACVPRPDRATAATKPRTACRRRRPPTARRCRREDRGPRPEDPRGVQADGGPAGDHARAARGADTQARMRAGAAFDGPPPDGR